MGTRVKKWAVLFFILWSCQAMTLPISDLALKYLSTSKGRLLLYALVALGLRSYCKEKKKQSAETRLALLAEKYTAFKEPLAARDGYSRRDQILDQLILDKHQTPALYGKNTVSEGFKEIAAFIRTLSPETLSCLPDVKNCSHPRKWARDARVFVGKNFVVKADFDAAPDRVLRAFNINTIAKEAHQCRHDRYARQGFGWASVGVSGPLKVAGGAGGDASGAACARAASFKLRAPHKYLVPFNGTVTRRDSILSGREPSPINGGHYAVLEERVSLENGIVPLTEDFLEQLASAQCAAGGLYGLGDVHKKNCLGGVLYDLGEGAGCSCCGDSRHIPRGSEFFVRKDMARVFKEDLKYLPIFWRRFLQSARVQDRRENFVPGPSCLLGKREKYVRKLIRKEYTDTAESRFRMLCDYLSAAFPDHTALCENAVKIGGDGELLPHDQLCTCLSILRGLRDARSIDADKYDTIKCYWTIPGDGDSDDGNLIDVCNFIDVMLAPSEDVAGFTIPVWCRYRMLK